MKKSKFILEEEKHHDKEAEQYFKKNEKEYMWEVPAEIFLLKKEYFKKKCIAIDFGCGPSTIIEHVFAKNNISNINYIGLDISKKMLEIAKRNIPWGKFIHSDMETAKFSSSYADIIISLGALHHSQNQYKTIDNWLRIVKTNGRILLREPLYEAFKKGEGESPNEEGIKIDKLINHLSGKQVKIKSLVFFTSPLFHLCNRVMIKLGLGNWKIVRVFWYPVIIIDVYLDKVFGKFYPFFHGLAFSMEIVKK